MQEDKTKPRPEDLCKSFIVEAPSSEDEFKYMCS